MSLLALQRDFQHWLTQEPDELPDSFDRYQRIGLAVYLNNYRSQLLACLSSSYPAVRTLIGDVAFDAAAARHIDESPPHSWTLDAYADGFPDLLLQVFSDAPHVAELAQLELALATAFVGPDAEPLDPAQISEVDWDKAILHLTPTFTLLPVTTNAGAIWSAINADETLPPAERLKEAEHLAIWRTRFESKFRKVSAAECGVLAQVRGGIPFGGICTDLAARMGEESGIAVAGEMLGQWLADGMIAQISGMPEQPPGKP